MDLITPQEMSLFAEKAYKETGIRFSETKTTLMSNRLSARMKVLGLATYKQYYDYLVANSKQETRYFIEAITTNETYFFRGKEHFQILSQKILESWRENDLTFWSAACSSGEEAYSLAIASLERLANPRRTRVKIFASDIDYSIMKKVDDGYYSDYAVRFVNQGLLQKYFKKTNAPEPWAIDRKLRPMISLGFHNLKEPFNRAKIDVVFCRNVLIYFDNESKKIVYKHLVNALKTGGYLFIGESEITPEIPGMERIHTSILRKK